MQYYYYSIADKKRPIHRPKIMIFRLLFSFSTCTAKLRNTNCVLIALLINKARQIRAVFTTESRFGSFLPAHFCRFRRRSKRIAFFFGIGQFLPRGVSAVFAVARCLSLRLSVTLVDCVKISSNFFLKPVAPSF